MLQDLRIKGHAIAKADLKISQVFLDNATITVEKLDETIRIQGSISSDDSMIWLVSWLMEYYKKAFVTSNLKLENIETAHAAFQKMRAFELAYLNTQVIPLDLFKDYLVCVEQFLTAFESLIEKREGCPSSEAFKEIRNDFSFLKKTRDKPIEQILRFYQANKQHLAHDMSFDKAAFVEKYRLYLDEAKAQKASTEVFTDPCVIPNLSKSLFGIVDSGVRRAPTKEELRTQIFQLFAIATPEKAQSRKRQIPTSPVSNKENANIKKSKTKPRTLFS